MDKIIPFPAECPDARMMMLDGKPEKMLSARGVILLCLSSWKLDKNELAHGCLRRYCEYISAHGYKGGAEKALAGLDKLCKGEDTAWIRRTFAKHVHDQNALIQYVMDPISGG